MDAGCAGLMVAQAIGATSKAQAYLSFSDNFVFFQESLDEILGTWSMFV
jgi:hypothetical protein